jgi:hypothetical protein
MLIVAFPVEVVKDGCPDPPACVEEERVFEPRRLGGGGVYLLSRSGLVKVIWTPFRPWKLSTYSPMLAVMPLHRVGISIEEPIAGSSRE